MSVRLAGERSPSATTTGTSLTSVVAAYPSIVSWMIGATMTSPKSRGFWRSSRNSFQHQAAEALQFSAVSRARRTEASDSITSA